MPSEPTPSPRRIKVRGKPPERGNLDLKGLSKGARRVRAVLGPEYSDTPRARLEEIARQDPDLRGKTTIPSSTIKNLVKEGDPAFVGPRTRKSIMREAFDEGSRQLPKVPMAEDDSQPIGQNDEIYRRLGEMLLRRLGSRRV